MSEILFEKRTEEAEFLDQREGDRRKSVSFEIRKDPLTGHVSRILPFRRKLTEKMVSQETLDASKKGCPFCPDQLDSLTPKFVSEMAQEGRLKKGRAVAFPNAFPYARHNWVILLSEDHFHPLDHFPPAVLADGFALAQEGIRRVEKIEAESIYSSINWNYLPQAGGGLYHPHLQAVVEPFPTASQGEVITRLEAFHHRHHALFWERLLSREVNEGKRYLGHFGDIHFLEAFSPRGIFGEVLILFAQRATVNEVSGEDWAHFAEGLTRVFNYLAGKQYYSFNLSLFSGTMPEVPSWVYARLCPRMLIPPWNTSDINYFEKLHSEVICVVSPEEVSEELKPFFLN